MKFVDEAEIRVHAGKGGDGSASFRREKYIPFGGPDGGDGGRGGCVYLVADSALNTLADFRVARIFKAAHGEPGRGKNRTGAGGADRDVAVPAGSIVKDAQTGEVIGDLVTAGERLLVAKGGNPGLGNTRFKSSTNRAPRKTTPGTPGEVRRLALELKLLADVGLVGLPNAGKSTLIRAMSAAKPKVADYPFTTIHPNLGVVSVARHRSFVMADVPGLIEGAADGAGLGIRFLKHLQRTRLLLHLVDVCPIDEANDPVVAFRAIETELQRFNADLADKERWLVLNKTDVLPEDEREAHCDDIVQRLGWAGPVYAISALSGAGTQKLAEAVMRRLEEWAKDEADLAEAARTSETNAGMAEPESAPPEQE